MLRKFAIALALVVLCGAGRDANAGEFVKADKHYRLVLESYWTTNPPPPAPLDAAFSCDEGVCGKRVCEGNVCNGFVQFVIGSIALAPFAKKSQDDFFHEVAVADIKSLAQDIAASSAQSYKEMSPPRKVHFGRNDYYVTDYDLLYKTGASRNMMYAVTFNRGYVYQLQFFTPEGTLNSHRPRFEQVLSSMEFLEQ